MSLLPPDCEWADPDAAFVRKIISFVQHVLVPATAAAAIEQEERGGAAEPRAVVADQVVGGISHPQWGGDGWHRWSAANEVEGGADTESWCRIILPGGLERIRAAAHHDRCEEARQVDGGVQVDGGAEASLQPLPAVIFLGTKRSVSRPSVCRR